MSGENKQDCGPRTFWSRQCICHESRQNTHHDGSSTSTSTTTNQDHVPMTLGDAVTQQHVARNVCSPNVR